jgi:hypothetical protein
MPPGIETQSPDVPEDPSKLAIPRWVLMVALLGLYLTLRGYHSRDGDQAYRLPLLLHQQIPTLYENDPFIQAFDQFNPHRGAILVLDLISRPLGLSIGLFVLFAAIFAITYLGIDRLGRATWPDAGSSVGLLAFVLFLVAKAGNIGTNHLFESMLLDRLQAFALGWIAISGAICPGQWGRTWLAPLAIGLATLIHPSAGLQLAMLLIVTWPVWAIARSLTGVRWCQVAGNVLLLGLAVVPGLLLNAGRPGALLNGLSPDDYWTLAVELQSPQHMLPHLWWMQQWLAFGSYLVLAGISLIEMRRTNPISFGVGLPTMFGAGLPTPPEPTTEGLPMLSRRTKPISRTRLALMLGVILLGLAAAWFGIEVLRDVRITVFQPFRMATIARGIALILISGHIMRLWRQPDALSRLRAVLVVVGLTGDWLMVVTTAAELAAWGIGFVRSGTAQLGIVVAVLGVGIRFLSRHDTGSGHIPLLSVLALTSVTSWIGWRRLENLASNWVCSRKRASILVGAAWTVPTLAILAGLLPVDWPLSRRPEVHALVDRCRFFERPIDDIECLAVWCRANTPKMARFIGPPGPKTFRLWSRRALAFNRASSPYHASGLADWFSRFRDHVGFEGSADEFVRQYIRDRHGVESRYGTMNPTERTQLAVRQGATHVIAAAPSRNEPGGPGPLELLHIEGRYAVYRVRSDQLATSIPRDQRQR